MTQTIRRAEYVFYRHGFPDLMWSGATAEEQFGDACFDVSGKVIMQLAKGAQPFAPLIHMPGLTFRIEVFEIATIPLRSMFEAKIGAVSRIASLHFPQESECRFQEIAEITFVAAAVHVALGIN